MIRNVLQIVHAALQQRLDGQVAFLPLQGGLELDQPAYSLLRRIAALVLGNEVHPGLLHALPVLQDMPAAVDQHALGPGEVPGGPQRQHGQAVAGVVQPQPVLLLEGLAAVKGEGGRPQSAALLAQMHAAGVRLRLTIVQRRHHPVVKAAAGATLLLRAPLDLRQQLLQLQRRPFLRLLLAAVVQHHAAQLEHVLFLANGDDAGTVHGCHGSHSLRMTLVWGMPEGRQPCAPLFRRSSPGWSRSGPPGCRGRAKARSPRWIPSCAPSCPQWTGRVPCPAPARWRWPRSRPGRPGW